MLKAIGQMSLTLHIFDDASGDEGDSSEVEPPARKLVHLLIDHYLRGRLSAQQVCILFFT